MDPRFFKTQEALSLADIQARLLAAKLIDPPRANGEEGGRTFSAIRSLAEAQAEHLAFFHNAKYADDLARTDAGLVLVPRSFDAGKVSAPVLPVADVHRALALVGNAFLLPPHFTPGIDPCAQVDPTAELHPSVHIGPQVVIGPGAEIGAGTVVEAQACIGPGVVLGQQCHLGPQVVVSHAILGDRVQLKPGARIGQRGFGWALSPDGHIPKPQVGRVLIGHDVEIGANTAVDRGSVEDTIIGDGTVIDNLCHIAHNCKIGRFCAIAATTAFAGTTVLGDFVQIGGAVMSKGHVTVADGAVVRLGSLIGGNIAAGADVVGNPARPRQGYQRLLRHWSRVARGVKGA